MKLLYNILLTFTACLLFTLLSPVNLVYVIYKNRKSNLLVTISGYLWNQAIALDRFGNYNFRSVFNILLKRKEGYAFGNFRETISSALGKNKINGTLSSTGKLLDSFLSLIDKDHSIKSIKDFPDDTE